MIKYYSVKEAADMLHVSEEMVKWWIRTDRATGKGLHANRIYDTGKPFDYVISEANLKSFMNTTEYRDYIYKDVPKPRVIKLEAIIELPADEYYDEGLERIIQGIVKDDFVEDLW
jgi:predicted transcriptional regulator